MKFARLLLSVIGIGALSLTEATDTLRRRKKNKPKPNDDSDKHVFMGSFITLTHFHEEGSSSMTDVDPNHVLENCFATAFGKTAHNGYAVSGGFISKTFMVPEDDNNDGPDAIALDATLGWNPHRFRGYSSRMFATHWDFHCRHCPDYEDDDYWWRSTFTATTGRSLVLQGNGHKALEAEFCNELRNSGDPMMAQLKHCYIEFTYSSVMEDVVTSALVGSEGTEDSNEETIMVGTTETVVTETNLMRTHLDIENVVGSQFSPADMHVVADIVSSSYNMVHAGLGYNMTDVQLVRRLDIPEMADATGPDDLFNRIWFLDCRYDCVGCKHLPPYHLQDRGLHHAFEDLVCLKLKTSGLPAYAKASDCEISFVLDDPSEIFMN